MKQAQGKVHEKAGSGDPNADAEARKAPPDPPESDEPLVGVPVDEYAGGTVVLPQAGEHTKSDEDKEAEQSGASSSDDQDAGQDGQDAAQSGHDAGEDADQHTQEIPRQQG